MAKPTTIKVQPHGGHDDEIVGYFRTRAACERAGRGEESAPTSAASATRATSAPSGRPGRVRLCMTPPCTVSRDVDRR